MPTRDGTLMWGCPTGLGCQHFKNIGEATRFFHDDMCFFPRPVEPQMFVTKKVDTDYVLQEGERLIVTFDEMELGFAQMQSTMQEVSDLEVLVERVRRDWRQAEEKAYDFYQEVQTLKKTATSAQLKTELAAAQKKIRHMEKVNSELTEYFEDRGRRIQDDYQRHQAMKQEFDHLKRIIPALQKVEDTTTPLPKSFYNDGADDAGDAGGFRPPERGPVASRDDVTGGTEGNSPVRRSSAALNFGTPLGSPKKTVPVTPSTPPLPDEGSSSSSSAAPNPVPMISAPSSSSSQNDSSKAAEASGKSTGAVPLIKPPAVTINAPVTIAPPAGKKKGKKKKGSKDSGTSSVVPPLGNLSVNLQQLPGGAGGAESGGEGTPSSGQETDSTPPLTPSSVASSQGVPESAKPKKLVRPAIVPAFKVELPKRTSQNDEPGPDPRRRSGV
ncbi:unnamed protein product [Amoebophrya sp. A25]|nr:unnamed protein product [Amoebophrya sp. A25]|eukprot:GSA25T00018465001.1